MKTCRVILAIFIPLVCILCTFAFAKSYYQALQLVDFLGNSEQLAAIKGDSALWDDYQSLARRTNMLNSSIALAVLFTITTSFTFVAYARAKRLKSLAIRQGGCLSLSQFLLPSILRKKFNMSLTLLMVLSWANLFYLSKKVSQNLNGAAERLFFRSPSDGYWVWFNRSAGTDKLGVYDGEHLMTCYQIIAVIAAVNVLIVASYSCSYLLRKISRA